MRDRAGRTYFFYIVNAGHIPENCYNCFATWLRYFTKIDINMEIQKIGTIPKISYFYQKDVTAIKICPNHRFLYSTM